MKYLLLVHLNEAMFNAMPESIRTDMLAESIQLCHQLHDKGQDVHASPLRPEATGTVVRLCDGKIPAQHTHPMYLDRTDREVPGERERGGGRPNEILASAQEKGKRHGQECDCEEYDLSVV